MELLIKNAKLVDETGEKSGDVLVRDGKIAAVGFDLPCEGEVIDAAGLTLLPAFVDLHVHFRDPGLTHKERTSRPAAVPPREAATPLST